MDPNTVSPEQMEIVAGSGAALLGGIVFAVLAICVVIYLVWALCVAIIAKKLGMSFGTSLLMAILPIANMILLLQMAKKPLWWVILILIPLTSAAFLVITWESIAEKMGKPAAWGAYIMLIPFVNVIYFFMLTFADEPKAVPAPAK